MVNHINAFFNTKLTEDDSAKTSYLESAGDVLLRPVRELTKGRSYVLIRKNGAFKELYMPATASRSWIHVVIAIIFLVPTTLLGTLLKGLAQFSSNAREHHRIAVINNTAIERKDVKGKRSIEEIRQELDDPYHRRIKTLVIEGNIALPDSINVGLKRAEIVERVVLVNTPFSEDLASMLSLRNFEPSPVSKVYFPPDDFKGGQFLVRHYNSDGSEALSLSQDNRDASGRIVETRKLTFSTKAALEAHEQVFEPKFEREREKIRTDRYFSRHPEGFISMDIANVHIAAYQVKTLDVALSSPLPKKHWLFSEKFARVFVVDQSEI